MSVPNQKIVKIQKEKYTSYFLQIGIDEWEEAFKSMAPNTFGVYLYLSGNANGFQLELSQAAISNELGMSKSSYVRAINELKELGYLRIISGNIFSFSPRVKNDPGYEIQNWDQDESEMISQHSKSDSVQNQNWNSKESKENIEIDNINNKNKIKNKDKAITIKTILDKNFYDRNEVVEQTTYMMNTLSELQHANLLSDDEMQLLEETRNKISSFKNGLGPYSTFDLYKEVYDMVRIKFIKRSKHKDTYM